jgi:hypothetical protein
VASRNIEWQRDAGGFVDFLERAARTQAVQLAASECLETDGVGYVATDRTGRQFYRRTTETTVR